MQRPNVLILNIDELWLKGANRPLYFKSLKKHISLVVNSIHHDEFTLAIENHRFILRTKNGFSNDTVMLLSKIPGIHSIVPSSCIKKNLKEIFPAIFQELKTRDLSSVKTFGVVTKRADKNFSPDSMEVSRQAGSFIEKEFGFLSVDLKNPDIVVEIRILSDHIFISSKKLKGTGGLPVGTGGRVITLLSGGIDSPVASYLMSKRGCSQTYIFFYAYPLVSPSVKDKIIKLAKKLTPYQKRTLLYIVPFGEIQKKIASLCKYGYRTLFFRKYMIEAAEILAKKRNARAVVTGDSLGQVSSQTLSNITALDAFSGISILRPLIGFNKIETIEIAKKIGTYDISIIPHDDACSILAPKHPIIRSDREYMSGFFMNNNFTSDLTSLLEQSEIISLDLKQYYSC